MTAAAPRAHRWKPSSVRIRAPLKLVLAGEYAVLEPGSFGISIAVDRYVACTAEKTREGVTIAAPGVARGGGRAAGPEPEGRLRFEFENEEDTRRLAFVRLAVEMSYRYVADLGLAPRPLAIACDSEAGLLRPEKSGATPALKLGLGTSAAATVAASAAVLAAHGVAIDRPTYRRVFFRLALLAHARAQGDRGSGIDVASSAHGGIIEYGRGDDARWLRRQERLGATPLDLVRGPWPGQHVEQLPAPRGLRLLAGFTGTSSATTDLLAGVERWKKDRPGEHETFTRLSQRAVRGLSLALRKGERAEVLTNVGLARKSLAYLGEKTGLPIETPLLEKLAKVAMESGGAAKLSGAGGGDCGIALAFEEETAREIEAGWREAGIVPIRLEVAPRGVREEPLESAERAGAP
jgi:phosphomevalonate kinase